MTAPRRAPALFTVGMISLAFCVLPRVASAQVPGDADFDGDVDNFDLMIILDNQGAIGGPGDANQDLVTDSADYELAKVTFDSSMAVDGPLLAPPISAGFAPTIYYNPYSGALLLGMQTRAPVGIISAFIITSNAAFNTNPIDYPFSTTPKNLATGTSSIIAQADPAAAASPPGLPTDTPGLTGGANHRLGYLLSTGLTLTDLQNLSLRGVYTGQISGQPGPHLRNFELVIVPEPGALTLALFVSFAATYAVRRGSHRRCSRLTQVGAH